MCILEPRTEVSIAVRDVCERERIVNKEGTHCANVVSGKYHSATSHQLPALTCRVLNHVVSFHLFAHGHRWNS